MSKYISRATALLLIPCLLAEPVRACARPSFKMSLANAYSFRFVDQALAPSGTTARFLGRRPLSVTGPMMLAEALTPRRLEVFDRVARGLPNKVIAAELGIRESTVKHHKGVLRRLVAISEKDFPNRSGLLMESARRGYFRVDPVLRDYVRKIVLSHPDIRRAARRALWAVVLRNLNSIDDVADYFDVSKDTVKHWEGDINHVLNSDERSRLEFPQYALDFWFAAAALLSRFLTSSPVADRTQQLINEMVRSNSEVLAYKVYRIWKQGANGNGQPGETMQPPVAMHARADSGERPSAAPDLKPKENRKLFVSRTGHVGHHGPSLTLPDSLYIRDDHNDFIYGDDSEKVDEILQNLAAMRIYTAPLDRLDDNLDSLKTLVNALRGLKGRPIQGINADVNLVYRLDATITLPLEEALNQDLVPETYMIQRVSADADVIEVLPVTDHLESYAYDFNPTEPVLDLENYSYQYPPDEEPDSTREKGRRLDRALKKALEAIGETPRSLRRALFRLNHPDRDTRLNMEFRQHDAPGEAFLTPGSDEQWLVFDQSLSGPDTEKELQVVMMEELEHIFTPDQEDEQTMLVSIPQAIGQFGITVYRAILKSLGADELLEAVDFFLLSDLLVTKRGPHMEIVQQDMLRSTHRGTLHNLVHYALETLEKRHTGFRQVPGQPGLRKLFPSAFNPQKQSNKPAAPTSAKASAGTFEHVTIHSELASSADRMREVLQELPPEIPGEHAKLVEKLQLIERDLFEPSHAFVRTDRDDRTIYLPDHFNKTEARKAFVHELGHLVHRIPAFSEIWRQIAAFPDIYRKTKIISLVLVTLLCGVPFVVTFTSSHPTRLIELLMIPAALTFVYELMAFLAGPAGLLDILLYHLGAPFVHPMAMRNPKEDFAMTYEYYFVNPSQMFSRALKIPLVRAKYDAMRRISLLHSDLGAKDDGNRSSAAEPDQDKPSGFTRRGLLSGLIAGAVFLAGKKVLGQIIPQPPEDPHNLQELVALTEEILKLNNQAASAQEQNQPHNDLSRKIISNAEEILGHKEWLQAAEDQETIAAKNTNDPLPLSGVTKAGIARLRASLDHGRAGLEPSLAADIDAFLQRYDTAADIVNRDRNALYCIAVVIYFKALAHDDVQDIRMAQSTYRLLRHLVHAQSFYGEDKTAVMVPILSMFVPENLRKTQGDIVKKSQLTAESEKSFNQWGDPMNELLIRLPDQPTWQKTLEFWMGTGMMALGMALISEDGTARRIYNLDKNLQFIQELVATPFDRITIPPREGPKAYLVSDRLRQSVGAVLKVPQRASDETMQERLGREADWLLRLKDREITPRLYAVYRRGERLTPWIERRARRKLDGFLREYVDDSSLDQALLNGEISYEEARKQLRYIFDVLSVEGADLSTLRAGMFALVHHTRKILLLDAGPIAIISNTNLPESLSERWDRWQAFLGSVRRAA